MEFKANVLEYAEIFSDLLEITYVEQAKTGFMDNNNPGIEYRGGNKVHVPMVALEGLANYDMQKGYINGAITHTYEELTMEIDRGRKFYIDPREVDQTNFIVNITKALKVFQKTKVVPEMDAYRLSKMASYVMNTDTTKNSHIKYGYTPSSDDIIKQIKYGIKTVEENNVDSDIIIMVSGDVKQAIEENSLTRLYHDTFSQGGINTKVPFIDDCPIITVPSNRFYTSVQLYDGETSGQESGGYVASASAKNINFMVFDLHAPIAVSKLDTFRIFSPMEYQTHNSWVFDYRRFHDLWVLERDIPSIYVNVKESA